MTLHSTQAHPQSRTSTQHHHRTTVPTVLPARPHQQPASWNQASGVPHPDVQLGADLGVVAQNDLQSAISLHGLPRVGATFPCDYILLHIHDTCPQSHVCSHIQHCTHVCCIRQHHPDLRCKSCIPAQLPQAPPCQTDQLSQPSSLLL